MKRIWIAGGCLVSLAAFFLQARAQQPARNETATLKIGDTAPDFALPDGEGKTVKLESFRGKQDVVVFFYPKAFTGG